jgi:iron(III) transport system permease protein
MNGWLWVAGHSARDITFPLFLITATNVVIASELYVLWNHPEVSTAAALAMVLVGGLLAIVVPVQIIVSRSGTTKRSSAD